MINLVNEMVYDSTICLDKGEGGLGLKNLANLNNALLCI